MQRATDFLNAEQRKRIEQAVVDAETQTSCEIVPVVATASGRYVFDQAEVAVMKMQGVVTWQITGEPRFEEAVAVIPDEDVELVAVQAGVSAEAAKAALVETKGDIAEAILRLSS